MADLDTALKRLSGIHVGCPWRAHYPLPDGTIGSTDRPVGAYLYSLAAAAAAISISVTLTDASNLPLANLTGLRYAWWDQSTLNTQVAPTVQGTGATTDASGVLSVTTLTGSALTAGQTGWLEVTDSDGTVSTTSKVAAGPVTVA